MRPTLDNPGVCFFFNSGVGFDAREEARRTLPDMPQKLAAHSPNGDGTANLTKAIRNLIYNILIHSSNDASPNGSGSVASEPIL